MTASPALLMLRTGIAALEHARDLRVKVGVSELQADALLQHIAALQSEVTTAHARADDWHQRASQMLIDLTKAQRSVAALEQRVEAIRKLRMFTAREVLTHSDVYLAADVQEAIAALPKEPPRE